MAQISNTATGKKHRREPNTSRRSQKANTPATQANNEHHPFWCHFREVILKIASGARTGVYLEKLEKIHRHPHWLALLHKFLKTLQDIRQIVIDDAKKMVKPIQKLPSIAFYRQLLAGLAVPA